MMVSIRISTDILNWSQKVADMFNPEHIIWFVNSHHTDCDWHCVAKQHDAIIEVDATMVALKRSMSGVERTERHDVYAVDMTRSIIELREELLEDYMPHGPVFTQMFNTMQLDK